MRGRTTVRFEFFELRTDLSEFVAFQSGYFSRDWCGKSRYESDGGIFVSLTTVACVLCQLE
jgi:hypothetical protein